MDINMGFPFDNQRRRVVTRNNTIERTTEEVFRGAALVDGSKFILSMRDSGYRDTSSSVSELIDNSIEAGAQTINIFVRDESSDVATSARNLIIAVVDDGRGMTESAVPVALQFGGSTRYNSRSGIGRYGMGLPNSSLSQARRVEVFTWQGSAQAPWYSRLDIDDLLERRDGHIPPAVPAPIPAWILDSMRRTKQEIPSHGTIVLWSKCDRLSFKKASTIRGKMVSTLGRVYRHYLHAGIGIKIDGDEVEPFDPLMPFTALVERVPAECVEELSYEIKTPFTDSKAALVKVRFTLLPVSRWCALPIETKRAMGIVGGAGVSVVRGKREIDYGWHLMGSKRRENYDDWWRCEVQFDPALDEYFGVTHSKQGIRPHPLLKDLIVPEMEQIARTLNRAVRHAFRAEWPANRSGVKTQVQPANPTSVERLASSKERWLPPINRAILGYRVRYGAIASSRLFTCTLKKDIAEIIINTDHPLYSAWLTRTNESIAVEMLIVSAARAELAVETFPVSSNPANNRRAGRNTFVEVWSDILASYSAKIRKYNV